MRRRDLILSIVCAATAWPPTAHAQQSMPVIGFLSGSSLKSVSNEITAFQDGLKEAGFLDGTNVRIEYRWAEQHYEQLPALANELVAHRVAVIAATGGTASVLAAKAATLTIPIAFVTGGDPVQQGIVASLNQPGGNATGVSWLGNMLQSKQFETLHELVPNTALFAALVNPDNPNFETDVRSLHMAADALGQKLLVVKANGENDISVGFATIVQQKAGGLVVIGDPFLISQRERLGLTAALMLTVLNILALIAKAGAGFKSLKDVWADTTTGWAC
jgi:putative tryptophan/tyrosine transport system substrate-binding protein